MFKPETATQVQDQPHQFTESASTAFVCEVCQAPSGDARHEAWEKANLVRPEKADLSIHARRPIRRETGS